MKPNSINKKIYFSLFLFLFSLTFYAFPQVSVNSDNTPPDPSAGLDVQFSDRGALIPRMTMAQRDSIANPANGLMVICTDCGADGTLNLYLNGSWKAVQFTTIVPAAPTAGTHVATPTQITWNWNAVAGATGYKWNTANDYNTATDMGTSTSKTQAGLTCNTPYTSYVWAYNSYGHSSATALAQTTSTCTFTCGNTLTINHVAGTVAPVNKTVAYGTVTNIPGEPSKCWITSNLGASQQATAKDDGTEASAGWYYQFNRKQGFKHDGTTRTPNTTWITSINENSDWLASNDPCSIELGNSWHIPTYTEWQNVDTIGGWTNWIGPYNSMLKLHAAGYLLNTNGQLVARGSYGDYWSSTQYSMTSGWYFGFNNSYSHMFAATVYGKPAGWSVRCLKDCSPTSPTQGTHTPSQTQIIWNWNPVSGATGYKWATTNNYSAATDMGSATTKTETSLTCNTAYTRYVWAYNSCGYSAATTLTQTTSACPWVCEQAITINHVAGAVAPVTKTVTYGTVTNIPGETTKCWITRNLGASQQATAVNDATEASAGWYWQFNRKQGYKGDGTGVTPAWTITGINENYDWSPANDPCTIEIGNTWRIANYTEWYNVDNTGNWTNWNGPYNSGLKLHAAGYLRNDNGLLENRGMGGYFWCSAQFSSTYGWNLGFYSNSSNMGNNEKAFGFSIRCVKD